MAKHETLIEKAMKAGRDEFDTIVVERLVQIDQNNKFEERKTLEFWKARLDFLVAPEIADVAYHILEGKKFDRYTHRITNALKRTRKVITSLIKESADEHKVVTFTDEGVRFVAGIRELRVMTLPRFITKVDSTKVTATKEQYQELVRKYFDNSLIMRFIAANDDRINGYLWLAHEEFQRHRHRQIESQ